MCSRQSREDVLACQSNPVMSTSEDKCNQGTQFKELSQTLSFNIDSFPWQ